MALAYAGKKLSERPEEEYQLQVTPIDEKDEEDRVDIPLPDPITTYKPAPNRFPAGSRPMYLASTSNPYIPGTMNNVGPVAKELVGPGLGVGPNVPTYGGYQQLFRVNPNNVNAYKLTTLPGRSGPAADQTGGAAPIVGELNHKMPPKTAFLPAVRPSMPSRAQGQGGELSAMTERSPDLKTARLTNRAHTSQRTDGLNFAPAKRMVPMGDLTVDPTRNKGDNSSDIYEYLVNNKTPGIASFAHGYTETPTDLRYTDKKGNAGMTPNPGRMNVRGDPLDHNGMLTVVRMDSASSDGYLGPGNGSYMQQYVQPEFQELNAYKGNENPYASSDYLKTAAKQMAVNPFAHNISS